MTPCAPQSYHLTLISEPELYFLLFLFFFFFKLSHWQYDHLPALLLGLQLILAAKDRVSSSSSESSATSSHLEVLVGEAHVDTLGMELLRGCLSCGQAHAWAAERGQARSLAHVEGDSSPTGQMCSSPRCACQSSLLHLLLYLLSFSGPSRRAI